MVEGERVDARTYGAGKILNAGSALTLPCERTGQDHSHGTASRQRSPVEPSREPKRQKTGKRGSLGVNRPPCTGAREPQPCPTALDRQRGNNAKRRRRGVRMGEEGLTSAIPSGKSDPEPGTQVGSACAPQVRAPVSPASNALKRPYIQHGVRPTLFSDAKQAHEIATQPIEWVVIPDTESESSKDDEN
jgi:hypothetical protein